MLGFIFGYAAANSRNKVRARRDAQPSGYAEWEAGFLFAAAVIGFFWPVHLGLSLRNWGLYPVAAIILAIIAGIAGLATGYGYLVIGFIYSGIWAAITIDRGVRQEQYQGED
jgi:hypothetical protein